MFQRGARVAQQILKTVRCCVRLIIEQKGIGRMYVIGNLSAAEKAAYRILGCGKRFDDFSFILL